MAANNTTPTKAIIQKYDPGSKQDTDYLTCQFNPASIVIEKSVTWSETGKQKELNAPDLAFEGGSAATFSLDLWFDTTSLGNQDVRGFTNKLLQLTLKPSQEFAPPAIRLVWGTFKTFRAFITQVKIEYKLFLPSGIPVRAKATVSLKQAADGDSDKLPPQNPTSRSEPRKTYQVQEGDRLDYLAYREYGEPGQWRRIAEANGLDDPLDIFPGQLLVLPQKM
jgi:hypothetical protein